MSDKGNKGLGTTRWIVVVLLDLHLVVAPSLTLARSRVERHVPLVMVLMLVVARHGRCAAAPIDGFVHVLLNENPKGAEIKNPLDSVKFRRSARKFSVMFKLL
jgi:hypothetical protein